MQTVKELSVGFVPSPVVFTLPLMSRLPVSMRDKLCAEVHQKYLVHNNWKKQHPPTSSQSDHATPAVEKSSRLPSIESEDDAGDGAGRVEKGKKILKLDLSILRYRFSENPYHFVSKEPLCVDRSRSANQHTENVNGCSQLFSPSKANLSFRSRRLQMIREQNNLSNNELVRKWSKHPIARPSGKNLRKSGTNEVLSIAIQSFGQGSKVSRKKRSRCNQVSLPPLATPGEGKKFKTRFKPIKVKDDQVKIARERRDFHNPGLYRNPLPFDHRGVSPWMNERSRSIMNVIIIIMVLEV